MLMAAIAKCLWTEIKISAEGIQENTSGSWLLVIVRSGKYHIIVLLDGILSKHDLMSIISLTQAPSQIKGLVNFMVNLISVWHRHHYISVLTYIWIELCALVQSDMSKETLRHGYFITTEMDFSQLSRRVDGLKTTDTFLSACCLHWRMAWPDHWPPTYTVH